ncbi:MAG: hypothetical protein ACREQV_02875, partial [Candidatus Binatia bacterium]
MSKHTKKLQQLGKFSLNQWLELGIALGGPKQVKKLLRCKKITVTFDTSDKLATVTAEPPVTPDPRWREEGGMVHFTLISNGTPGEEWITQFEANGRRLNKWAKALLRSPDFKPTNGVAYNVAVLKGELFSDSDRITWNV